MLGYSCRSESEVRGLCLAVGLSQLRAVEVAQPLNSPEMRLRTANREGETQVHARSGEVRC